MRLLALLPVIFFSFNILGYITPQAVNAASCTVSAHLDPTGTYYIVSFTGGGANGNYPQDDGSIYNADVFIYSSGLDPQSGYNVTSLAGQNHPQGNGNGYTFTIPVDQVKDVAKNKIDQTHAAISGNVTVGNQNITCGGSGSAVDISQVSSGSQSSSGQSSSHNSPCSNSTDVSQCRAKAACDDKSDQGYTFLRAFYAPGVANAGCFTLPDFLGTALNYLMMFATIIAGALFVKGAYGILVSRGTPQAVADARETILNATIGLVILATCFIIVRFLNGSIHGIGTGITLLGPWFP